MVLIETVDQKKKIRDSETSRPKIRESETQRNTRKRDFETHSKRLRDFEIGTKISETLNFPDTVRHPFHSLIVRSFVRSIGRFNHVNFVRVFALGMVE